MMLEHLALLTMMLISISTNTNKENTVICAVVKAIGSFLSAKSMLHHKLAWTDERELSFLLCFHHQSCFAAASTMLCLSS